MTGSLAPETYLPESGVADVHDFLAAHEVRRGASVPPRYLLVGDQPGDQVEIPVTVYRVLLQVVDAMAAGKAVTVSPQSQKVTTQVAADLLGVSRPTVVRLIDSGKLPAERIGTRRMLLLVNVLTYRSKRRRTQLDAIAATSVDLDEEEDPRLAVDRLREARRALAEQEQSP